MTRDIGPWRQQARVIIAGVLAELPSGTPLAEVRKRVNGAFPWGEKAMHPYRMWCKEVRIALGARGMKFTPSEVVVTPDGVQCGWCKQDGCRLCLACSNARRMFREHPTDWKRWQQWLDTLDVDPRDRVARLVFADWLESQGWDQEAARQRRVAHG